MKQQQAKPVQRALVLGAGGFIGHHLVKRLKREGYYVTGVDLKEPQFEATQADEFHLMDLRNDARALRILPWDEVYQLAANMGGMGFIGSEECAIMHDNVIINANCLQQASEGSVGRYFFSSSVCVYPDLALGHCTLDESAAYPAMPDNEYGWEKLYSERMALAYARNTGLTVRIGRFKNTYGPLGTWQGGREKAPAALCRKALEASQGGDLEIWGDGTAMRSFTYITDLIDGIRRLMLSDIEEPVNIGTPLAYNVEYLAGCVVRISGKDLQIRHVDGPVGVANRNFDVTKIQSLGWCPQVPLYDGLRRTYEWIATQMEPTSKH